MEIPENVGKLLWEYDRTSLGNSDAVNRVVFERVMERGGWHEMLWFLVREQHPLDHYLGLFRQKYDSRDVGHVVRSLVFFDDADSEPELRMLLEAPWETVKKDFLAWVGELLEV